MARIAQATTLKRASYHLLEIKKGQKRSDAGEPAADAQLLHYTVFPDDGIGFQHGSYLLKRDPG